MQKIHLKLRKKVDDSYNIFIELGIEKSLQSFLQSNYKNSKICIISDNNTAKLFGDRLLKTLKAGKHICKIITFPGGEKNKTLSNVEKICNQMVQDGFSRKDLVIALGGGVTGDLAGFAASIFMRGVGFVQVPTSLLAMVDSSIGGKTGVDLTQGKNLVGTFQQPKAVFIDVNYIKSLPEREFNNGMAEIIKHGIIRDAKYFQWIEKERENIKKRDTQTLIKLIARSCSIKKEIVEKDEKESGLRMILNYGHTVGHALEQLSGYKLRHGEAISIGMIKENNLSIELSPALQERIKKLFIFFGLPTEHKLCNETKKLLELIKNDKKKTKTLPVFAIPRKLGKMQIKEFTASDILKALHA